MEKQYARQRDTQKTAAQAFNEEKMFALKGAEEDTLSCILNSPLSIKKVADVLKPEHFYHPELDTIYQAALKIYEQGRRCTVNNVEFELEKQGKLEEVGGIVYLRELAGSAAVLDGVEDHAHKVIFKARMRNLAYAASEIASLAVHEEDDAVERALEIVSQIALGTESDNTSTFADEIDLYMKELRQRMQDRENGVAHGLDTGISDLNKMLGGLQPASLYTLGALTGYGKSALALNVGLHIALNSKHVLFFSLEMRKSELVQRALSIQAEKDQSLLRDALIDDNGYTTLQIHANRLKQCDIKLDDDSFTINAIKTKAKRIHARKKLDLVVVDYLQLIEHMDRNKNATRAQEISDLSRALKRLSQELNVPVLALVQLNREVEKRQEQLPKLSDINESGGIARDSDAVMFLYSTQEELEKRDHSVPYQVVLRVSKARSGRLGEVPLMFSPRITKFKEIESTPGADYND